MNDLLPKDAYIVHEKASSNKEKNKPKGENSENYIVKKVGSFPFVPPPPQYDMLPPVTEHVSLHSKSLCKKWHVRLGAQIICTQ